LETRDWLPAETRELSLLTLGNVGRFFSGWSSFPT
jgi:hypothetical protein